MVFKRKLPANWVPGVAPPGGRTVGDAKLPHSLRPRLLPEPAEKPRLRTNIERNRRPAFYARLSRQPLPTLCI